jgi:UDP-glucose 4-epimerase
MKTAVIGGAGFIGKQLVCGLQRSHIFDVTSIDILENTNCKNVICDITNSYNIQQALVGFDYVYLLAAESEASKNTTDPVNSMDLNLMGTVNVLNSCVKNKIKKIFFCSTVWVYDACESIDVNEDTPFDPTYKGNLYTTSKICGEMLIKSYQQTFGLTYTILRLGTAYGHGCNPRTAMASFVRNAHNGETIKIFGNGEGFRSFMHISDHVNALMWALTAYVESDNQIINFDGPDKVTLNGIIEMLKDYYPELKVEYVKNNLPDYMGKNVSCEKAMRLLGGTARVKFKEGLQDYVEWFKNTNSSNTR